MRTRIKKFRNDGRNFTVYLVQELCDDGVFRTIDGGVCDTEEQAEKVRKSYKAVGKFVRQFNEKYRVNHVIRLSSDFEKCKCQTNKGDEEGRD